MPSEPEIRVVHANFWGHLTPTAKAGWYHGKARLACADCFTGACCRTTVPFGRIKKAPYPIVWCQCLLPTTALSVQVKGSRKHLSDSQPTFAPAPLNILWFYTTTRGKNCQDDYVIIVNKLTISSGPERFKKQLKKLLKLHLLFLKECGNIHITAVSRSSARMIITAQNDFYMRW